jgi:hypothetical protein
MERLALLSLCFAATAAVAAPAPLPRRGTEPGPCLVGWDRPGNPEDACRFVRRSDWLRISVPGPTDGLLLDVARSVKVPRLMRDVEGDFVLTVRVSSDDLLPRSAGDRAAGLLLFSSQGKAMICLEGFSAGKGEQWCVAEWCYKVGNGARWCGGFEGPKGSRWLRMERRGQRVHLRHSQDGKQWADCSADFARVPLELPARVKAGVFARARADGAFDVYFDNLELEQQPPR